MIKILCYTEILGVGGVEKMLFQWISRAPDSIKFDIYTRKITNGLFAERIKGLGCNIFEANCGTKNLFQINRCLKSILKNNHYDVIHVHTASSTDFFIMRTAKKYGIKNRITHSHNVAVFKKKLTRLANRICKPLMRHYSTHYWGCSKNAIAALFGKAVLSEDYLVVKNGIDVKKYQFDETKRREARDWICDDENQFVVGSIGRLDYQKDYAYLLRIIKTVTMQLPNKNIKVVIVGEGEFKNELTSFASENGIKLLLAGNREDVDVVLNGFDLFLLTSRYEGLPVVMVEAQTNGLRCICSEAIPEEAVFSKSTSRINKKDYDLWAGTIKNSILDYCHNPFQRAEKWKQTVENGFDISESCSNLYNEYLSVCKEN